MQRISEHSTTFLTFQLLVYYVQSSDPIIIFYRRWGYVNVWIRLKASIRCTIIKYLFQIHTEYIPNENQFLSTFNQNPFQKWAVARCTGPVFSSTDDVFSATGDVFEASGRAAAPECQKGERAGCFWIPRGEPLWSKSAKKSPGVAPKGSKKPEKAIPKSMQKIMPKKDTKCIPKAFQNGCQTHRFVMLLRKRLKRSKLFVFQ